MAEKSAVRLAWRRVLWSAGSVLLVVLIFLNSMDNGETSGGKSLAVLEWFNSLMKSLHLPVTLSEYFVRKSAHFLEYALLGAVLTMTLGAYAGRLRGGLLSWPLLLGLLTAVCDEFLQTFIPARSGMVQDVLLDFSGVLTGVLAVFFLCRSFGRRGGKQQKESR